MVKERKEKSNSIGLDTQDDDDHYLCFFFFHYTFVIKTHHIKHCTTKETNCAWLDLTLVYYIFHNTSYFTGVHPNSVDDMYNLSEKKEPSTLHFSRSNYYLLVRWQRSADSHAPRRVCYEDFPL